MWFLQSLIDGILRVNPIANAEAMDMLFVRYCNEPDYSEYCNGQVFEIEEDKKIFFVSFGATID